MAAGITLAAIAALALPSKTTGPKGLSRMTAKSRARKLRKKLKNKENTNVDHSHTSHVRRTESHTLDAQRDLRERWERRQGGDPASRPAHPGEPPRA